MNTNAETAAWARRYRAALRKHLEAGPGAGLPLAAKLGRRAAALGLETLAMAMLHEQALAALSVPGCRSMTGRRTIERARRFFSEAITPIERTHRAALKADFRANQLTRRLRRRTLESSASTRKLEQSIARRQAAEAALKESGKHRGSLLRQASRLQARLRRRAREVLLSNEDERQKLSAELHDEIAQTLLGIDVRLLTLKRMAKSNRERLKKEIVDTQSVVQESASRVKRFDHEFGIRHKS